MKSSIMLLASMSAFVAAAETEVQSSCRDYAYRLDWLQGSGSSRFITDYKVPWGTVCIDMGVRFTVVGDGNVQSIFCANSSTNWKDLYELSLLGDGTPRFDVVNNLETLDFVPVVGEDIAITTCGPSCTWTGDGGRSASKVYDRTLSGAWNYLALFASYYDGTNNHVRNYSTCQMMYCRVGETNKTKNVVTPMRDYIPVMLRDGVAALYDQIEKTVLHSEGAFIAGPRTSGDLYVGIDSDLPEVLNYFTAENGFSPFNPDVVEGCVAGETVKFRAPSVPVAMNDGFQMRITGYDLYEFDNTNKTEKLVSSGVGTSLDYVYRSDATPRLVWKHAFEQIAENIDVVLTSGGETRMTVPEGKMLNVLTLGGKGGTLVKDGKGELVIEFLANKTAQIAIEAGAVRLVNPKPTAAMSDAVIHLDASVASSLRVCSLNGTNFVNQWFDADGRSHWATNCMTITGIRTDPANRRPYLVRDGQNGLPIVSFGALLKPTMSTDAGSALAYGAAMTLDTPVTMVEGFSVFSDTEDYLQWSALEENGMYGMALMTGENSAGWYRGACDAAGRSVWSVDNGDTNPHFPQSAGHSNIVCDLVAVNTAAPRWVSPSAGFHLAKIMPETSLSVSSLAAETAYKTKMYGGQKIGEYLLFTRYLTGEERDAISHYLMKKWFPVVLGGVTVGSGAKFTVEDNTMLEMGAFRAGDELCFSQRGESMSGFKAESMDLPLNGTIRLTVTAEKALHGKKVKLVDCSAISGTLEGWTTVVSGCKCGVKVILEADGIFAEFGKPGLVLIVR